MTEPAPREGERGDAGERHRGGVTDTDGKPITPGEKKKNDRRQTMLIALTFAGVVVTYLIYRSSRGGAAAGSSTSGYMSAANRQAGLGAGFVAGAGDPSARSGFNAYLHTLEREISTLEANNRRLQHRLTGNTGHHHHGAHFIYRPHGRGLNFIYNRRTGRYGEVMPGTGLVYWLTRRQWVELGRPKATAYGARRGHPQHDPHPHGGPHPEPKPRRNPHPPHPEPKPRRTARKLTG